MARQRLVCAACALLVGLSLAGCAYMRGDDLKDEVEVLQVLRDYEMAVATYDGQTAMGMYTDEYEGWRGSGKEGIVNMVERMAERESSYEIDLSEADVSFDGDTATIEEVVALTGRWEMKSTYVLVRTDDGWKINAVEFQR